MLRRLIRNFTTICMHSKVKVYTYLYTKDHPWNPKIAAVVEGGRCPEIIFVVKVKYWDLKMVAAVDRWLLFRRWLLAQV